MSCRISPWRAKRRIDLFGVWRRRVSLGKCVNVSMSVRRGGCTGKQEGNGTLKGAKSLGKKKKTHQKKKKRKKKKKKQQDKTKQHGPRKVSSKAGWHKSKKKKKAKKKRETKQNKHTFLSARHISACRRQNNTERVRGIKIKPLSVSDCFMNPCRSGGSTPHQTL